MFMTIEDDDQTTTDTTATRTLWIGNDPNPDKRLQVDVSPADFARVKADREGVVTITDLRTGRRLKVQATDCGLDCRCALGLVGWLDPLPPTITTPVHCLDCEVDALESCVRWHTTRTGGVVTKWQDKYKLSPSPNERSETIMWLDINDCDQHFHEFLRDRQTGRWIARHADGEECEECEFEWAELDD